VWTRFRISVWLWARLALGARSSSTVISITSPEQWNGAALVDVVDAGTGLHLDGVGEQSQVELARVQALDQPFRVGLIHRDGHQHRAIGPLVGRARVAAGITVAIGRSIGARADHLDAREQYPRSLYVRLLELLVEQLVC